MIILRCARYCKTVRITIPRAARNALDVAPGDALIFESLGKGIAKISHARLWAPKLPKEKK